MGGLDPFHCQRAGGGSSVGWLPGWLAGWLLGWLAGWLGHRPVADRVIAGLLHEGSGHVILTRSTQGEVDR